MTLQLLVLFTKLSLTEISERGRETIKVNLRHLGVVDAWTYAALLSVRWTFMVSHSIFKPA